MLGLFRNELLLLLLGLHIVCLNLVAFDCALLDLQVLLVGCCLATRLLRRLLVWLRRLCGLLAGPINWLVLLLLCVGFLGQLLLGSISALLVYGNAATDRRLVVGLNLLCHVSKIILQLVLDLLAEPFFSLLIFTKLLTEFKRDVFRHIAFQVVSKGDLFRIFDRDLDLDRLLRPESILNVMRDLLRVLELGFDFLAEIEARLLVSYAVVDPMRFVFDS